MNPLRNSWSRAWKGVGARSDSDALLDRLIARYSEPHRKYHTLQHLTECLALFASVRDLPEHPAEVETALWFHDAIYDVNRHDNEVRSADWARSTLIGAGVPEDVVDRVGALILTTRHSGLPIALDEQLIVDIDLSILGAPEPRFAEYEQQIREEYADVEAPLFRRKRREILRGFLDRPRIYSTEQIHKALEARARENLGRAVSSNTDDVPDQATFSFNPKT